MEQKQTRIFVNQNGTLIRFNNNPFNLMAYRLITGANEFKGLLLSATIYQLKTKK